MQKSKIGRPSKYTKESFADKVEAYIEWRKSGDKERLATLLDFCVYAEVNRSYISEHNLNNKSKLDFSQAIKRLKLVCECDLEYYGLLGQINIASAIFCLRRNYGWNK